MVAADRFIGSPVWSEADYVYPFDRLLLMLICCASASLKCARQLKPTWFVVGVSTTCKIISAHRLKTCGWSQCKACVSIPDSNPQSKHPNHTSFDTKTICTSQRKRRMRSIAQGVRKIPLGWKSEENLQACGKHSLPRPTQRKIIQWNWQSSRYVIDLAVRPPQICKRVRN